MVTEKECAFQVAQAQGTISWEKYVSSQIQDGNTTISVHVLQGRISVIGRMSVNSATLLGKRQTTYWMYKQEKNPRDK